MEPAHLRVLGPVELRAGGSALALSDLERGLLALTAFREQVSADDLVDWLWGDDPPASVRNRVQGLVSGVRRKAGAVPVLLTAGRGYRLGPDVRVDYVAWSATVRRARELSAQRPAESIAAYDRALSVFGDRPLDGTPPTTRAEVERDRLVQERLRVVEERLTIRIDSGRSEATVAEAAALAAQHPFHEGFIALYVLALAAAGQQRRALEVYRTARDRLATELGIEPSAQLRTAHQRVLRGEVPVVGRQDVAAGTGARPAQPRAASSVLPIPQTLPRPLAGFVGRDAELAAIVTAAEGVGERAAVASITGLTGVGKSALAVEAGARLRTRFPDGNLYADLSATNDGGVAEELGNFLRLLGVLADAVPGDFRSRAGLFRSLIAGRQLLVVLDNVDGAGEADARLTELLPATPGSFALITSRAPVDRLDPTVRIRLNGLPHADAVALLRQAAEPERIDADPEAVRSLVRHTGALPLALRLLGGRLAQRPDLTVRRLARWLADERGLDVLDDVAAAESSLRASLSMVWSRLPEQTRLVARLLAALPLDGFGAWVPRALLADGAAGERAMNSLIDANFAEPVLVPHRAAQYRLHDLMIRFAREQEAVTPDARLAALRAVGRTQLERLAGYHGLFPLQFLPLPPGVVPPVPGGESYDPDEVAELLLTELATARGCARALAPHDTGLAWRLLAACENGHQMSADQEAWAAALDTVTDCLDPVLDDDRLGAAILTLCRAWHLQDALGEYGPALNMAAQARRELTLLGAVELAMAAGLVGAYSALALSDRALTEQQLAHVADGALRVEDPVLTGWRHIVQGELYNDYDELEECERELVRAREVLADTGERVGYAYATAYLSRALRRQRKLGPARILADEALADFARLGADHAYTVALDARAEVSVELGHGEEALEQATNALTRARATHDAFITARATRTRGRALRELGRFEEAAVEFRSAIEQFAGLNRTLSVAATLHDLAMVQDLMGEPAAAGETLRQERAAQEQAQLEAKRQRAVTRR